ncbi:MAG: PfkB family carbohydrate kinase [Candidatus Omnitrophota bacterium]
MSLLIVGSVALDSIKTPYGEQENVLGGSATYCSICASHFTTVRIVAVVGRDFPRQHIDLLQERRIDLAGLQVADGQTFRWKGFYTGDLNSAQTVYTHLNVFNDFAPAIPPKFKNSPYLFLANIDPRLQHLVLKKMNRPKLVACDTMNFWIKNSAKDLKKLLKEIDLFFINDAEARQLAGEVNLLACAKFIFSLGPKKIIIKRGDSGAILFDQKEGTCYAPAHLLSSLKDPTGAGDTFAGGCMGYLSRTGNLTWGGFRRALIQGTVMASFCVEDFGPGRIARLTPEDFKKRRTDYRASVVQW